jgi:hypothetical protein
MRNMELLFFMFDDDTEALMKAEIPVIASYRPQWNFTVHMPDTVSPSHGIILEYTADIASSFIIHPPREDAGIPAFVALLDAWRTRYGKDRFLLENTVLSRFEPADAALGASRYGKPRLCADVGHLRMEGLNPSAWIAEKAGRIDELHVHGFDGTKDHVPFAPGEPWIDELAAFARSFAGIIEMELFSWAELEPSMAALRTAWALS